MRILSLVRTTALALAATAVIGGTLSPVLANEGNTEHFRVTYALPRHNADVVAKDASSPVATDAKVGVRSIAPTAAPLSNPDVASDGFGRQVLWSTGTTVPGTPSNGY